MLASHYLGTPAQWDVHAQPMTDFTRTYDPEEERVAEAEAIIETNLHLFDPSQGDNVGDWDVSERDVSRTRELLSIFDLLPGQSSSARRVKVWTGRALDSVVRRILCWPQAASSGQ